MSESLEETEMKMVAAEIEASLEFKQMDKASGLLNMPASCHSILKVSSWVNYCYAPRIKDSMAYSFWPVCLWQKTFTP